MTWTFYNAQGQQKRGAGSSIPLVTALPGSPVNGQEIYYQDASMATDGVVWHLRYNASSASAYKWEFVGGPPLRASVDTDQTFTAGATFVDAATVGPQVTLPLAGDYSYGFTANLYVSGQTTGGGIATGLGLAGAQPTGVDVASSYHITGIGNTPTRMGTLLAQPASRVVKLMHQAGTALGGTPHTRYRELQVTPVRVG